MIKIQLTEENILKCNNRCQEMVDHFNEVGVGEYGHNNPKSTMKGLKGEVAFDQWISDKLPDSLIERSYNDFKNRKAPDFKLGQRITEIKSIDKEYWKDLGRMLPPKQLKAYKRKNALVYWFCSLVNTNNINSNVFFCRPMVADWRDSPMAEASDLKSLKCGFESHSRYH